MKLIGKIIKNALTVGCYNNLIIENNQKKIVAHIEKGKLVLLNPVPPKRCGGNVEHFFHFLFDLVYPLARILKKVNSNGMIYLEELGVLTKLVVELFGEQVRIVSSENKPSDIRKMDLIGMNPVCVPWAYNYMEGFVLDIFKKLNIERNENPLKVILIERMQPDHYFIHDAKIKGAGTMRRSILNHLELQNNIKQIVKPSFEFQNVQLENMTFLEQVITFKDAKVVIAQHGASMGNLIWMNDQSIIIELNWLSKPFFRNLANKTNKIYFEYNYKEEHIEVDVERFLSWILGKKLLRNYFNI